MTARRILIAIGNPLRSDDGVAQRVLELLSPDIDWDQRQCQQLTPELAEGIAVHQTVVFLDADAMADEIRLDELAGSIESTALSHAATASEILALSQTLFGFTGRAWLCRIPAYDFSHGEGLSARAEAAAQECAVLLQRRLDDLQFRHPHEQHFAGEEEPGDEQGSNPGHETEAAVSLGDLG